MKTPIFFLVGSILSICCLLDLNSASSQETKVNDEVKLIIGKWDEEKRVISGRTFPKNNTVAEFFSDGRYKSSTIADIYTWKYYPDSKAIILHNAREDAFYKLKLLNLSQDSLNYEVVTINGIVEIHHSRLK